MEDRAEKEACRMLQAKGNGVANHDWGDPFLMKGLAGVGVIIAFVSGGSPFIYPESSWRRIPYFCSIDCFVVTFQHRTKSFFERPNSLARKVPTPMYPEIKKC